MSFDRPSGHGDGDRGDRRPDRPRERPFPGAPENRPYVPPPTGGGRSWDDVRAEKRKHTSQREYEASLQARREAAKNDSAKKPESADAPPKADAKPDAHPDETSALRKRIADLEADKTRQDAKIAKQAAEISGLRTELSDRKAADVERDWRDQARDDKIADQAKDIDDLKAAISGLLKEHTDKHPDATEGARDNPGPDERTLVGEERESKAQKPERKLHVPSNTKITLITSIIGEAAAADHVPTHTSDYVGIGVATASLGAAAVAAWREHRKKDSDGTND